MTHGHLRGIFAPSAEVERKAELWISMAVEAYFNRSSHEGRHPRSAFGVRDLGLVSALLTSPRARVARPARHASHRLVLYHCLERRGGLAMANVSIKSLDAGSYSTPRDFRRLYRRQLGHLCLGSQLGVCHTGQLGRLHSSVLLGVGVLGERLRPLQWFAICLAVVAVVVISIGDGVVPWISLALALTEGVYGLLKKQASLSSLDGVAIETGALFLPSVGYLVAAETHGQCAFGHVSIATSVLLIGAGIMATTTLLAFGYAVQHVPLTLIGVLRFLTPTIQVCLAVFVYHEQFSLIHSVGFVLLWTALVIFTTQSYTIQQEAKRRKKYDVEMDDVDVLWSHATQSLLDVQDDAKAMYQSI